MNKLKQYFKNLIHDKDSISFFIHSVLMEITICIGLVLSVYCNIPVLSIVIFVIFVIFGIIIMLSMFK